MAKRKIYTPYRDVEGKRIRYGQLISFTWWAFDGYSVVDLYYKVKIRHRKNGDIFEFFTREGGTFTHRLSALNWSEGDLSVDLMEDILNYQ